LGKQVLITGAAGFIGSHLADELLAQGYRVRGLDNLAPQVHGLSGKRPDYLSDDVELIVGDVRNPDDVRRAIRGVDAVFHYAAAVGVGQSMYQIAGYTDVNNLGTAVLLEALSEQPIEKLVVASSMSLYGEGMYRTSDGRVVEGKIRPLQQLKDSEWEVLDERGCPMEPAPTPETKTPNLASIYALSKFDQERMGLMIGQAYKIPTVALRFFNVFGTRQALSNPYTGVLAIFASRLLNNKPPVIFEDGNQIRNFVSVKDVATASRLALENPKVDGEVFNVGNERTYGVNEVAELIAKALDKDIQPEITGQYRVGDIRHCYPDMTKARNGLGFQAKIALEDGIGELAEWVAQQEAADHVETMRRELNQRGLAL